MCNFTLLLKLHKVNKAMIAMAHYIAVVKCTHDVGVGGLHATAQMLLELRSGFSRCGGCHLNAEPHISSSVTSLQCRHTRWLRGHTDAAQ